MSLVKKPVTGMRDILPEEMRIRRYALQVIRDTYARYGFTEIETPVVESLENLLSRQGGDNEKLIFRILKRGEKLKIEGAKDAGDLSDGGLRYDLTVPLVRYYAAHVSELPSPFKALQTGNVFRADRPQKGRFRQFMQCDIDILGEPGVIAEIELITATTHALGNLGFSGFVVRISDRRLLKEMADFCGFPEEAQESVFITLDKMDKIGPEGVKKELEESGFAKEAVEKCMELFSGDGASGGGLEAMERFCASVGEERTKEVRESLTEIFEGVGAAKCADFSLVFDPTLVRGMGYYTGTIFEIGMSSSDSSCGGGGRYDKMIGKFGAPDTPAIGFSIGFERIIMLLEASGFRVPGGEDACAYLVEKGIRGAALKQVFLEAAKEREEGKQVLVVRMNKNKKFQKEQLTAQGYAAFREFYADRPGTAK